MEKKQLGLNISYYRRKLGISQMEFAERVHYSRTHISAVERGVKNPSVDMLNAVAEALGVPVSKLLEER